MSNKSNPTVATMGIDIGKNSFHVIGLDQRGAIMLRQKWSRRQIEARLANIPPSLIGMEACVGAHHLSRKLQSHGHDAHGRTIHAGHTAIAASQLFIQLLKNLRTVGTAALRQSTKSLPR